MTTVIIKDNSPQAKKLLEYIKTLPFVTVVEDKSFEEVSKECNAIPAKEFTD